MPHSALCSVPCSVECFLQLPSKIPVWNYKVVLLWRVCTACCCEYVQVPPCIRPFMSGFDPLLCCKDKISREPFFLYLSVSEISTSTIAVELYWMCVVQDVWSPVLGTIDLRSSFFFCRSQLTEFQLDMKIYLLYLAVPTQSANHYLWAHSIILKSDLCFKE